MMLEAACLTDLDKAIVNNSYADYVYMYPPRQAYRDLDLAPDQLISEVSTSLPPNEPVNIYIHIPFCRQICRFCNLYTTAHRHDDAVDEYIRRLDVEISAYADAGLLSATNNWPTIYFGGGTPSILSIEQLERVLTSLRKHLGADRTEELAIEVSPETVTADYLRALRDVGFERVSMGLQTTSATGLRMIGRNYSIEHQHNMVEAAVAAGFRNVCVDLIFGLPGESMPAWEKSVQMAIDHAPETICAYAWTQRPNTGFDRLSYTRPHGSVMREMFRTAHSMLTDNGYERETHVRWKQGEGGYLQKEYHWSMGTLIGLGAGARSYFKHIDLRNGYSVNARNKTLALYMDSPSFGWLNTPNGIPMTEDERRRKAVILGIHSLDRSRYRNMFGEDVTAHFGQTLHGLLERGLVDGDDRWLWLTPAGMEVRDLLVQLFFSDQVRQRTQSWTYDE
ncbi:coproporphyrinogen-III oxidase family protein [Nocardia sp. NPDC003726]